MTIEARHMGSQPRLHQTGPVIQEFGTVKQLPLGLSHDARLVSQVVRTGEQQAWFLAEHLVDTPLVRA